jgi:heat shock protein HtpX
MGAAEFVEHQRINRRATVVVLLGTFVLLGLVANALALVLGGHSTVTCSVPQLPADALVENCTTSLVFQPVVFVGTLLLVVGYLVVAYLMSGRAALALSGAHLADPAHYAQVHELVEQMAIAAGIPKPAVYVTDDPAPNAFATGRDPKHAAVTVTTGLLATLSHRELRGVIAHEVSHIKNRDIAVTTIAVLSVGVIAILAELALHVGAVAGRSKDSGPFGLGLMALGLAMFMLAVPAAMLLRAALSRRREALADATAVELTREPMGLRSALEKLEADSTVLAKPHPAVAHLWIESPLQRGVDEGLLGAVGRMFNTHPPLADRIALLRSYEGLDPTGRGPNDPSPQRGVDRNASRAGPPPGWYPSPANAEQMRWWDGRAWSGLVRGKNGDGEWELL